MLRCLRFTPMEPHPLFIWLRGLLSVTMPERVCIIVLSWCWRCQHFCKNSVNALQSYPARDLSDVLLSGRRQVGKQAFRRKLINAHSRRIIFPEFFIANPDLWHLLNKVVANVPPFPNLSVRLPPYNCLVNVPDVCICICRTVRGA
jgi:hypothetical protein